jgi:hypothetical protein
MARTFTLAQLRTAVQRRGGVENSYDLTDSVLNEFINSAATELWDILRKKGDDALTTSTTTAVAAGATTVALPSTFYKLRVLQIADPSMPSGYRRLFGFTLEESHLYSQVIGKNYRYRLQGSNIVLSAPTPVTETFRIYYVPYSTIMASDAATLDGFSGYEELVVVMAWRKCLERQRLDTSSADREIARLMSRVSTDSDGRDSEPFSLVPRGGQGFADDMDIWEW